MDKFELLQHFLPLPTGNVADAMAQLGIPCKTVNGLFPLSCHQGRTAGYAVTVRQMERNINTEGKVLTKHTKVIDGQLSAGDLLVIDAGGNTSVCTGGALLALRAKLRGASGFLINGCLRDLNEIRELGFPVYLKGGSPIKSSPSLETVGINIPVEINGTQILPGDLIVMDETGIVIIPIRHAERILEEAGKIFALESQAEKWIREGCSVSKALHMAAQ